MKHLDEEQLHHHHLVSLLVKSHYLILELIGLLSAWARSSSSAAS